MDKSAQKPEINKLYVFGLVLVVAMGGFLHGAQPKMITPALGYMFSELNSSYDVIAKVNHWPRSGSRPTANHSVDFTESLVVSLVSAGGIIGSITSGSIVVSVKQKGRVGRDRQTELRPRDRLRGRYWRLAHLDRQLCLLRGWQVHQGHVRGLLLGSESSIRQPDLIITLPSPRGQSSRDLWQARLHVCDHGIPTQNFDLGSGWRNGCLCNLSVSSHRK